MVVHNTDSIFVKLPAGSSIDAAFDVGGTLATRITKALPSPMCMEFEKTYTNLLLVSKKRYAALKYTKPDAASGVECKGLQVVRRDSCPYVREVAKGVLEDVIGRGNVQVAIERVSGAITALMTNKVSIELLTLTKSLRAEYKNTQQPHLTVAKLQEMRMPGSGPRAGDRVAYVHCMKRGISKISEAVDDPLYVQEHGIELDSLYYVDHQLRSPIEGLIDAAMGRKCWAEVFTPVVERHMPVYRAKRLTIVEGYRGVEPLPPAKRQTRLAQFFQPN
jgi:DNA polymerase delta subunit 1